MIVRPVQSRTPEQTAFLEQLIQSDATVAQAVTLAQDFGRLLRKREGLESLEQWKTTVRASGITELIAFADGLADDAEAVANGCSMTWNNGMVEGFVNKVKGIKRSSYGQAGFPLLQLTWSAEPPPPPRALVTQVNGLPYLPSRPSRR